MEILTLHPNDLLYAASYENGNLYAILPVGQPRRFDGNSFLWILSPNKNAYAKIETGGVYHVKSKKEGRFVEFEQSFTRYDYNGYPHCDFLGNRFQFALQDDGAFEDTLAKFYWESILNECAERTVMRKKRRLREGYILSTLKIDFYGGTYPAVDHEFHTRGRFAFGDAFDLGVVERMLRLQLRMMQTDWRRQYRNVLSLQPNGRREYRVYRKSFDKKTKAIMFLLTGNLEIVEEIYSYYCLTKDTEFLREALPIIEKGLDFSKRYIDKNGRLWADVYYEDQVMKDGANAQAQAFAISAFRIMAKLEDTVGCYEKAEAYRSLSACLAENYVKDLPNGYWDASADRYADWIDRKGRVHDHVHLLSNALSVTLGLNDKMREESIIKTIHEHDSVFQKFPSFVAAKIEDYTNSEIGSSPYDLCAAGRYWCHDAKFRRHIGEKEILKQQLLSVCKQAKLDDYKMGERYDMNYVYYNTGADAGRNWHGSPLYYEYPNVFADVLIHDYIGILPDEKAEFSVCPCLANYGTALMESYGIRYQYAENEFIIENLYDTDRTIRVDLSKLFDYVSLTGQIWNHGEILILKPNQIVIFAKV